MSTVKDQLDRDRYKLIADKIMQLLAEIHNTSLSEKRWVWELLQNAKDVPNKFGRVSVEIELYAEGLIFRHNGDYFSVNNLSGLIQQVSSKNSQNQEGQTGKFGTGFITTHLLSPTIDVRGVVKNPNTGDYQHFNINLDRRAKSSEEMVGIISNSIRYVERLDDNDFEEFPIAEGYEERTEEQFYTSFTYALTGETLKAAQIGLDDLINTLPLTMISQRKKLKSVRVIDHTRNTDERYICESETEYASGSIEVLNSTITISGTANKTKRFFTYRENDVVELSIEYILKEDGKILLQGHADGQPNLLRDFPLIGSDRFYFPYFLNGCHFEPTEKRDGLYLNKQGENSIKNRSIIDTAVKAALAFNEWLISKGAGNTYLMASSREPIPVETWDDDYAKPWISNLQKEWRSQLLGQSLVETENGSVRLSELRLPDFEDSRYKHDERFYDFASGMMESGELPLKEQLRKWQGVVHPEYKSWNACLKYTKTNFLEELASCESLKGLSERLGKDMESTTEWIKELVDFLIEAESEKAFTEYAILPDEKGNFHSLDELKKDAGDPIPESVKKIYDTLLGEEIASTLLHGSLSTCNISGITTFGFKDAIKSINEAIDKKVSNYTIYRYDTNLLEADCKAILRIVNTINPDKEADDVAIRMRELINPLLPAGTTPDMIEGLESTYWKTANRFVLSMLPRVIDWSYSDVETFAKGDTTKAGFFTEGKTEREAIEWLNLLFTLVKEENLSISSDIAIYPDENGRFHALDNLHYDKGIPEEYKELDRIASDRDWNAELLHRGLTGFENHQPYDISTVYDSIKESFEKRYIPMRDVIALRAISLIPASTSAKHGAVAEIYRLAKTIYSDSLPESVEMTETNGFDWEKFASHILDKIASKVSESVDVESFCSEYSLDEAAGAEYVDSVIDYAETYYDKRHRDIVEEGHGVWVNQHGDFISFTDIHIDNNIPEELKDISLNKRVDYDFREELADTRYGFNKYLPAEKAKSREDVLKVIDDAIRNYVEDEKGNLQQADFTQLVLDLHSWNESHREDYKITNYFDFNHDRLMVGSLTEKSTLTMIGKLIGDKDKLEAASELLAQYSANEIRTMAEDNAALQKENEALKASIAALESGQRAIIGGADYSGLSEEEKAAYSEEARKAVRAELESRGYIFTAGTGEHSIVPGVKKGSVEYPLVVKSHRYDSPIQINPNEWIELGKEHAMLWVYFGNELSKPVAIEELLRNQDKLTLSFDTDNLVEDKRMMRFAEVLRYFKNLHFDVASLAPEMVATKGDDCFDFNRTTDRLIDTRDVNDSIDNL